MTCTKIKIFVDFYKTVQPLLMIVFLLQSSATAQDSHYATFIPLISDQIDLPIDGSSHTVNIDEFASTNSGMIYEIVHSFDSTDSGSPTL